MSRTSIKDLDRSDIEQDGSPKKQKRGLGEDVFDKEITQAEDIQHERERKLSDQQPCEDGNTSNSLRTDEMKQIGSELTWMLACPTEVSTDVAEEIVDVRLNLTFIMLLVVYAGSQSLIVSRVRNSDTLIITGKFLTTLDTF